MTRKLFTLLAASTIALGVAGGASAQNMQLDDSVMSGLSMLGVSVPDDVMLSDTQVAEIENVLGSAEDDTDKVARIERIFAQGSMPVDDMNSQMLRDSVMAGLSDLGFSGDEVGALTLEQAAEIENVTASSDDDELKKARIETILGGTMEGSGMSPDTQMLMDSVELDLSSLGIPADTIGMLSLSQLAEIENVTGSSDDDQIKRDRINVILGN